VKKREVTNRPIVSLADAPRLAEPMLKENPDELTLRVLEAEPAAFGLGANVAKQTCDHLASKGVSEPLLAFVFSQICYAGAMSIEIMRLGSAKHLEEFIAEHNGEEHE
jgi:hypothetical protein